MFFDSEVEIWKEEGLVDLGGGVVVEGDYEFHSKVIADIQPYTNAEVIRDYGLDLEVSHILFLTKDVIDIGTTIVKVNGDSYRPIEKAVWEDEYVEVVLDLMK